MKLLPLGFVMLMLAGCIVINASPDGLNFSSLDTTPSETVKSVSLRGGGEIIIKRGDVHAFENTGTSEGWQYGYDDGGIVVGCDKDCRRSGDASATVYMTELEDIALTGGGSMRTEGQFDHVRELNLAITGGGEIQAETAPADEVNVSIVGGGEISVAAERELNVSIVGGGQINYLGSPEINRSIIGGGSVERIR
ncbi:MAG: hypothetical protein CMK09_07295 [Ponticaulis sp.]|nr:hypothetical protein [Ponticaulis sp.]|tara:strand:+ start:11909 stop:12493 length:585 start_codon:yes stop_codon:yes gene_type:complete